MTPEQKVRWRDFVKNFSTYDHEAKRYPIFELLEFFEPYYSQRIPLREAVKDEPLAKILRERKIPPEWAGCFSWTEVLRGQVMGIFRPDIRTIIRKMLVGRKFRGLQVLVEEYDAFMKGETFLAPKNYVLAWSPDKPNIEENIEGRTLEEKIEFVCKELDYFINEVIPRLRNGSELGKGYIDALESVRTHSIKAGVEIDTEALEKRHVKIQRRGDESYQELLEKCELARIEMEKYKKETIVLNEIELALQRYMKMKDSSYLQDHPAEDYISLWVIQGVRKSDVKEEEIREILRILKLPEDNIITIKGYGFTQYTLPDDEEDKRRLLKEAEFEKLRRRYLMGIMRTLRPLDKEVRAYLELDEHGKPKTLRITVWRQVSPDDENKRKTIIEELEAKGFKVNSWTHHIKGVKEVSLKGEESLKELQNIAKRMLTFMKIRYE